MQLDGPWYFKVDTLDRGTEEGWYEESWDRSDWAEVIVPEYWDRYNLEGYDGTGWFMTRFTVASAESSLALFFGGVDDDAEVWINGKHVGGHVGYSEPFYFELTDAVRDGENLLVIRVHDYSGPGGIYKPISLVPMREVERLMRTPFADLPARPSEEWVKDAVIYEVYLRSFSKEGTFKALERRLPELKDLGVTVVWLMPIHPVGELNRKGTLGSPYAVQDYYEVNPAFGTKEDFRSLVKSVHAHGMKIIIDLVANHTAWDAKLIMEHPDWYTTDRQGAIVSPNADWHDVADLNYNHHELRKYMIEMMRYWVKEFDIDGYRCDVAEMVPTDFWERARKELDKIKPVMMLSEGTLPEHHVEAFDLTYSWNFYDVLDKVIHGSTPVKVFDDILLNEARRFPQGSLRMRFNTNHDKNAWDAPATVKFTPQGAKATALLAFTFPGVPLIYNGEEVGNERRLDLFEKVEIDWSKNKDVREFFRKIGTLRHAHPALRRGTYQSLQHEAGSKMLAFLRRTDGDDVLVVINFGREPKSVTLTLPGDMKPPYREYFSGTPIHPSSQQITLHLGPLDYRIVLSGR
jgi:glycosidase